MSQSRHEKHLALAFWNAPVDLTELAPGGIMRCDKLPGLLQVWTLFREPSALCAGVARFKAQGKSHQSGEAA